MRNYQKVNVIDSTDIQKLNEWIDQPLEKHSLDQYLYTCVQLLDGVYHKYAQSQYINQDVCFSVETK